MPFVFLVWAIVLISFLFAKLLSHRYKPAVYLHSHISLASPSVWERAGRDTCRLTTQVESKVNLHHQAVLHSKLVRLVDVSET